MQEVTQLTDQQLLDLTLKQMRTKLCGIRVSDMKSSLSGKVIDIEVMKSILGVSYSDVNALREHIVCHVWSGTELWQAKASQLTAERNNQNISN